MPKLFVAIDLPTAATAELARLQPQPLAGLRLVLRSQMHLTLHYVGEAEVDRLANALAAVALPMFSLTLEGVGQFQSANGAVTLWAGIKENADLQRLHAAVAAALAETGFQSEARRYTPHISLARCSLEVSSSVVDKFLSQHKEFLLPEVLVNGFGLYSSGFDGDVPVYKCERSFPLQLG